MLWLAVTAVAAPAVYANQLANYTKSETVDLWGVSARMCSQSFGCAPLRIKKALGIFGPLEN